MYWKVYVLADWRTNIRVEDVIRVAPLSLPTSSSAERKMMILSVLDPP